jgi:hypothetical protein
MIAPGGKPRLYRERILSSAMDGLLAVEFAVAEKGRLHRCLNRLREHKQQ